MTAKTTNEELYSDITEALEDYSRELVDVLDHISDDQEIQSYGKRSEKLDELGARWLRHTKDQEICLYYLWILDQDGRYRTNQELPRSCVEKFDISPDLVHQDPTEPPDTFRISITEKEADDLTEEVIWLESEPYSVELEPLRKNPARKT